MKRLSLLPALALVIFAIGCASQSRVTFNTLASVQTVTTGAYNAYLDAVLQKQLTTNAVPVVSKSYNDFQMVWSATVIIARWQTNNPPTVLVTDAATKVINSINQAKKGY